MEIRDRVGYQSTIDTELQDFAQPLPAIWCTWLILLGAITLGDPIGQGVEHDSSRTTSCACFSKQDWHICKPVCSNPITKRQHRKIPLLTVESNQEIQQKQQTHSCCVQFLIQVIQGSQNCLCWLKLNNPSHWGSCRVGDHYIFQYCGKLLLKAVSCYLLQWHANTPGREQPLLAGEVTSYSAFLLRVRALASANPSGD